MTINIHCCASSFPRLLSYLLWPLFTKHVPFDLVDDHINGRRRFPFQSDLSSWELSDLQVAWGRHLYWEGKKPGKAESFIFSSLFPGHQVLKASCWLSMSRWQGTGATTGQLSFTGLPFISSAPKWQSPSWRTGLCHLWQPLIKAWLLHLREKSYLAWHFQMQRIPARGKMIFFMLWNQWNLTNRIALLVLWVGFYSAYESKHEISLTKFSPLPHLLQSLHFIHVLNFCPAFALSHQKPLHLRPHLLTCSNIPCNWKGVTFVVNRNNADKILRHRWQRLQHSRWGVARYIHLHSNRPEWGL